MEVRAIRVGQRIDTRKMQNEIGFRVSLKDPLVVEYAKNKYIGFLRYGVVVFWNCGHGEINEILSKLNPFIIGNLEVKEEEEVTIKLGKTDEIKSSYICVKEFDVPRVALVSIVLARSLVLDYFEGEVGAVVKEFDKVVNSFAENGRSNLPTRGLLKKVGIAMSIQHAAVNQMAMLDRPDITWEHSSLDQFYNDLAEEYQLEDRYEILSDKLKILFRSVEFILGYIESRRNLFLELTIVFLILIEVLFFLYEQFFV